MEQNSVTGSSQYFEVLSIPRYKIGEWRYRYKISLSIIEVTVDGESICHPFEERKYQGNILSVTFDKKLDNIWIFYQRNGGGALTIPICVRMNRQIQEIPKWSMGQVQQNNPFEERKYPKGLWTSFHPANGGNPACVREGDCELIFTEHLSSNHEQSILKINYAYSDAIISFKDGDYQYEIEDSILPLYCQEVIEREDNHRDGKDTQPDREFPNICPRYLLDRIRLDNDLIDKDLLKSIGLLDPAFIHQITPQIAEEMLEQKRLEEQQINFNLALIKGEEE